MERMKFAPHLPTSDVGRMVRFYESLGFSPLGEIAVKEGREVFAQLELNGTRLRVELWDLPEKEWKNLRHGFAVTTLWIDVPDLDLIAKRLQEAGIPYDRPHRKDSSSTELELFDPEGFRVIFARAD